MAVVDPKDHGAVGDGVADDLAALGAAVTALPAAGGIVYLPEAATFKKTNLLVVTKSHVKFWAANRQAELFQSVAGQRRHQSILCRSNAGCGFFGLTLRSDAAARFDALEDNQIAADHASLVEVVGCEIHSSAAVGIFLYGSSENYIEGNYVHHTWADHIHHTDGARQSWVWNNFIFNDEPSKGDDGVACVTYGPASARCADMEWWRNTSSAPAGDAATRSSAATTSPSTTTGRSASPAPGSSSRPSPRTTAPAARASSSRTTTSIAAPTPSAIPAS